MIKFVTGTANLDISERLCSEIPTLIKSKEHIVYIVPEQFEYASELKIYNLLEENGLLHLSGRVKVKTFTSLSREVLDKCNDTRPIADDIVKSVIIHKAINECATDLKTFSGTCKRPGFAQKILSTIEGFKAIGLSSKDLAKSLDKMNKSEGDLAKNTLLMSKLTDVSLLYSEYSAKMNGYLDAPDITELAATSLATSGVLNGADIIVDCFNDFTGGQMKFITSMIPLANSVMFGFTTNRSSDNDVFQSANGNITDICDFAKKEGIKTEFVKDGINPRKGLAAPISELSLKIFSDEKSNVAPGDSIELISAAAIPEELDFVCSKIIALAEEKEFRYRDIAVLCTNLGTYGRYVESAFKKYNIPIFLDTHESILNQPLTNTVISILNALKDFSVDTVISCLKTGFFSKPYVPKEGEPEKKKDRVGLTNYDVNSFEDYVFEWAITTNHLKSPFKYPINNDSDKPDRIDYKKQAAETIRREVAVPLYKFSQKVKKGVVDGAELTEMLYNFLDKDVGIERAITARTVNQKKPDNQENQDGEEEQDKELYTTFDKESKALHSRLWNALISIFNALHKELEGVEISIKDYTDMFRDLCADTTLSSPPQMVDRVLIGDIDRTRANGVRAAFIVGATYESFPTDSSQTGVFSQYEAELICSGISEINKDNKDSGDGGDGGNIEIFKSAREQFALAKYRAYKAMTLPTDYLCITAPEMDAQGEGTERSEVTHEVSRMFTKGDEWCLEVRKASTYVNRKAADAAAAKGSEEPDISRCLTNEFYCRSEQAAKSRYALNLGVDPYADAVLEKALEKNDNSDFVKTLKEIHSEHDTDKIVAQSITPDQAKLLFPNTISATLIEKLCACPFHFFTVKGLNIRDKTDRTFNKIMRGNAIHYILEKVLTEYNGDLEELCKLNRADFLGLSEKHLKDYCDLETNGDFNEDERSRFLFRNITHSASDVLISMQAEFFARGYRPKFFELDLSKERQTVPVPEDPLMPSDPPPVTEIYSDVSDKAGASEKDALTAPKDAVLSDKITIDTAPFEIKVDDSFSVYVTGRIDRVDMYTAETGSDKTTYLRMVDYKSSNHTFSLGYAINGINVQMLLYMLAILDANKGNSLNLSAGEVTYISSKSSGASDKPSGPFMILASNHLGSNLFIKDETLDADIENYKNFLKEKVISEDGKTALLNAAPDTLTNEQIKERKEYEDALKKMLTPLKQKDDNHVKSEDFDFLRESITEKMTEKLSALFKEGNISAAPITSNSQYPPCKFCKMQSICKNGSKNVKTASTTDWKKFVDEKNSAKDTAGSEEEKGEEE